jgi:hypothetical protein
MARTTKSDILIPEIFTDAVQAAFAQKGIFKGSMLAALGAAVADGSFGGGADSIGNEVEVPYFGTMGEFEENIADGTAATPKKIQQTSEKCTVSRDTLAFECTRWGRNAKGGDAYTEAAQQVVAATMRAMDKRLITAASSTSTGLVKSVYSATVPKGLDYDLLVDGLALWGDEQDDVVGMVVHSRTMADLFKLRDSNGNPFLTQMADGGLPRFMGIPVAVSDRCPLAGSSMATSPMTEAGTTPPDVTLAGTPLGAWDLKIIISVGGTSNGTAKFKFSTDGGNNYSAELTVPNGGGAFVLTDTAIDSLVGVNGASGITATFTNGTYNVDNIYTSKALLKASTLLLRRNSLAFWYNQAALQLQTDRDILVDSDVGAVHLYAAALRYRRRPGGTKPGVVVLQHNVGGY